MTSKIPDGGAHPCLIPTAKSETKSISTPLDGWLSVPVPIIHLGGETVTGGQSAVPIRTQQNVGLILLIILQEQNLTSNSLSSLSHCFKTHLLDTCILSRQVCMGDYYMALSHEDWELPN